LTARNELIIGLWLLIIDYWSSTGDSDILLNVFLAIAVDNLADADALNENDAKDEAAEVDAEGVVYEVRAGTSLAEYSYIKCAQM